MERGSDGDGTGLAIGWWFLGVGDKNHSVCFCIYSNFSINWRLWHSGEHSCLPKFSISEKVFCFVSLSKIVRMVKKKKSSHSLPLGDDHSSHFGLCFSYACVYIYTLKGKLASHYTLTMYRHWCKVWETWASMWILKSDVFKEDFELEMLLWFLWNVFNSWEDRACKHNFS